MCEAVDPAAAPLHCVVRIIPAQVPLRPGRVTCIKRQQHGFQSEWQTCCTCLHISQSLSECLPDHFGIQFVQAHPAEVLFR